MSDPCPLPTTEKKRTLDDKDRLVYAPFSGVGGLTYDKDAVYIELGGSHSFRPEENEVKPKWRPGNQYFDNIISSKKTIDSKLAESKIKNFSAGDAVGDLEKRAGADSEESGEDNKAKWKENMKLNAQMNFVKNKVTNWSILFMAERIRTCMRRKF